MIVREFRKAWRRLMRRAGYALPSVGMMGVGLQMIGVSVLAALLPLLRVDPAVALHYE